MSKLRVFTSVPYHKVQCQLPINLFSPDTPARFRYRWSFALLRVLRPVRDVNFIIACMYEVDDAYKNACYSYADQRNFQAGWINPHRATRFWRLMHERFPDLAPQRPDVADIPF